jgi:hypothetical protein
MKFAKTYKKSIFCLEGNWTPDLRKRSSVRAVLEFLSANCNLDYIHRDCGTVEELAYYLKKWPQRRYQSYPIGYLAFHGKPGLLEVDKNQDLTMEELGDLLAGKCKDRILLFGSCNALDISGDRILHFLEETGCLCVCGYRERVDWIASSAFDILLIDMFQYYRDVDAVERQMQRCYGSLVKNLRFRIFRA